MEPQGSGPAALGRTLAANSCRGLHLPALAAFPSSAWRDLLYSVIFILSLKTIRVIQWKDVKNRVRYINRMSTDVTGQQIGFGEFLLEAFTFGMQKHCKVMSIIAPPTIKKRLRTNARGIPTFSTLQRHQITVIVKRRYDNMHKIELTLTGKQYNSQIRFTGIQCDSGECYTLSCVNPVEANKLHS